MSISNYSQQVERLEREISRLQQKISIEEKKEADLQSKISSIRSSIKPHTSPGLVRSKSRQIEQFEKELSKTIRKKADVMRKLADKSRQLANRREQLQRASEGEQRRQQRLDQQRERQLQRELASLQAQNTELKAIIDVNMNPGTLLLEVYVLEDGLVQGTCFNLAGIGLVTCQHVLTRLLVAFHPSNLVNKFPVEELAANKTIDLARISAVGLQLGEGLPLGSADDLEVMDEIYLAGYPNYRYGDTGTFLRGYVTGFRIVSSIRRILLDTPIIGGNSGGPVLNRAGEVVGVAVTGADRMEDALTTENHGVVPIDALSLIS